MREPGEVFASFEVDIGWKPDDTFSFRFTSALDFIGARAKAAGVVQPSYQTTSRPERELTTIIVEGSVAP